MTKEIVPNPHGKAEEAPVFQVTHDEQGNPVVTPTEIRAQVTSANGTKKEVTLRATVRPGPGLWHGGGVGGGG